MKHAPMSLINNEQYIFESDNINKETKIELQGHMNRLLRESDVQKNRRVTTSSSPTKPLRMNERKIIPKDISYLKFIYANVQNKLEQNAYTLVSALEKSKVITIDNLENLLLKDTSLGESPSL